MKQNRFLQGRVRVIFKQARVEFICLCKIARLFINPGTGVQSMVGVNTFGVLRGDLMKHEQGLPFVTAAVKAFPEPVQSPGGKFAFRERLNQRVEIGGCPCVIFYLKTAQSQIKKRLFSKRQCLWMGLQPLKFPNGLTVILQVEIRFCQQEMGFLCVTASGKFSKEVFDLNHRPGIEFVLKKTSGNFKLTIVLRDLLLRKCRPRRSGNNEKGENKETYI
ncbi:hypothetical protein BMS3Abin05_01058 [bacterium BMS3Abin05]|nr:hypothetical protein BMS3Abin05_01058 [bacterium BMS3Abin05]